MQFMVKREKKTIELDPEIDTVLALLNWNFKITMIYMLKAKLTKKWRARHPIRS